MIQEEYNKFLAKTIVHFEDPNRKSIETILLDLKKIIPYKLCSLWKINNISETVSVYARHGYNPPDVKLTEFVHKIDKSLIGAVLKEICEDNGDLIKIDLSVHSKYRDFHMAPERIKNLGLQYLYSIPILNKNYDNATYKYDAILNIYPIKEENDINSKLLFVRDLLSIILSKIRSSGREKIANRAIEIYKQKKKKSIANVLVPIIKNVIQVFIPCQGCSIFVWDPTLLRLQLKASSGVKKYDGSKADILKDAFYYMGEGITGTVARLNTTKIITNIHELSDPDLIGKHLNKIYEVTESAPQSMVLIPINKISNNNDVIGIIRLVNKLNPLSPKITDYFSVEDCDLLNSLSLILSFILEVNEIESRQAAFASQMNHELKNPAAYIYNTATMLLNNIPKNYDEEYDISKLLERIRHRAESMITTSYQISIVTKKFHEYSTSEYDLAKTNIIDCIQKARLTLFDELSINNIDLKDIQVKGNRIDIWFDRFALERIFVNLIANAIKYRDIENKFSVVLEVSSLGDYEVWNKSASKQSILKGIIINISDLGVGIPKSIENDIFMLGFRRETDYSKPGNGIGLSVVDQILSDFGSLIWVSSNENPTKFTIFLPECLLSRDKTYKILNKQEN